MGDRRLLSALLSVVMGSLVFANSALAQASPLAPANDEFEDAKDITSLPYNEIANNLAATDQIGEPKACHSIGKSTWYRLTLPNDQIVRVGTTTTGWGVAAVYRGSSLDALGTVNCGSSDWGIRFAAKAGMTHYIQIGGLDAGPVVGNINIESISGIAGNVIDHLGSPVEFHCLTLYDTSHRYRGRAFTTESDRFDHPLAEGVAGSYLFPELEDGDYKVQFACYPSNFFDQWYDDRSNFWSADIIHIENGEAALGIDAQLKPRSSISGTLIDDVGNMISSECVAAYDEDGYSSGFASTNSEGKYKMWLLPGTYRVRFGCSGEFASEHYNDKPDLTSADPISVGVEEHVAGIDAVLVRNGVITGRLSTSTGGLEYECVAALDLAGNYVGGSWSFEEGVYRLYVPTGSYKVRFGCDESDYHQEFFNDKADAADADVVSVTAPDETPDINAELVKFDAPDNDHRANAIMLGPPGSSIQGTTRSATHEDDERSDCYSPERSVWYRYTAASSEDLFLTLDNFVFATVYLSEASIPHEMSQVVACGTYRTPVVTGFRAVAGRTYLIRIGSDWPTDFTLESVLGTGSVESTFEASTACSFLCPYWNLTRDESEVYEATCAPTPDAPPGSWDDITFTVPEATEELTPTHVLYHIEPELDFDAWLCRDAPDPSGSYFVHTTANSIWDPCPTAYTFGCFENGLVPVSPGETYVMRVYNWSDKPTTPGGYSFLYGEIPKSPTPIPIRRALR